MWSPADSTIGPAHRLREGMLPVIARQACEAIVVASILQGNAEPC
jgi:hypothetical protein